MEETINAIKAKACILEGYADVLETLEKNVKWYQHTDDETGELVDDTEPWSIGRLTAYRNAIAAVKKLAGV